MCKSRLDEGLTWKRLKSAWKGTYVCPKTGEVFTAIHGKKEMVRREIVRQVRIFKESVAEVADAVVIPAFALES